MLDLNDLMDIVEDFNLCDHECKIVYHQGWGEPLELQIASVIISKNGSVQITLEEAQEEEEVEG